MLINRSEPASTEDVVNEGKHDADDDTADRDDSRSAHRAFACTKSATITSNASVAEQNKSNNTAQELHVMKACHAQFNTQAKHKQSKEWRT